VEFLKSQAKTLAIILAIISAVFMPASVLLGIGAGWGAGIAFILVGAPVLGIIYLMWIIPGRGKETRFTVFIKLVLSWLLFWILSAMEYHIGRMVETSVVIESLNKFLDLGLGVATIMIIYYIIKLIVVKPSAKAEKEAEEGREKLKQFVGEKVKEAKEKKIKQARIKKLEPVRGLIVNCINATEEGTTHLSRGTKNEVIKVKEDIKELDKNIRMAWRELRKLRDKAEGREREELERLAGIAHVMVNTLKEEKVAKAKVEALMKSAERLKGWLRKCKAYCGTILRGLDSLKGY